MFLLFVALVWTLLAVPFEMLDLISDSLMRLLGLIATLIASLILLKTLHAKPLMAVGLSLHRAAPREFGYGVVFSFLMQATMFLVAFAAGWLTFQSRDL